MAAFARLAERTVPSGAVHVASTHTRNRVFRAMRLFYRVCIRHRRICDNPAFSPRSTPPSREVHRLLRLVLRGSSGEGTPQPFVEVVSVTGAVTSSHVGRDRVPYTAFRSESSPKTARACCDG